MEDAEGGSSQDVYKDEEWDPPASRPKASESMKEKKKAIKVKHAKQPAHDKEKKVISNISNYR